MENMIVLNERPSYLGKKRDTFVNGMDTKYGKGNWEFTWKVGDDYWPFQKAIFLYEGAYFIEMYVNVSFWKSILLLYSECYDNNVSNVNSGLDYSKQENNSNHYQDVAVRRCMLMLGLKFGDKTKPLMWVRHNSKDDGALLSPGRVKFHRPELIEQPFLPGWWESDSVEAFWQNNKHVIIKNQAKLF